VVYSDLLGELARVLEVVYIFAVEADKAEGAVGKLAAEDV
jgi:hypothetical protein